MKRKHSIKLKKFMRKSMDNAELAMRDTILDTVSRIEIDAPVDKAFLRANFQIGVNVSPTAQLDTTIINKSAQVSEISNFKWGDDIYIANNMPYARKREFEGGKTAPAGMMRRNVAGFSDRFRAAFDFYQGAA